MQSPHPRLPLGHCPQSKENMIYLTLRPGRVAHPLSIHDPMRVIAFEPDHRDEVGHQPVGRVYIGSVRPGGYGRPHASNSHPPGDLVGQRLVR